MHGDHATRVALVPGAAGSAAFWSPITERLPDDWIVTAIDLPGLGSVPARDGIRGYADLAEYVAGIVAAPSAIVAQSMGAYVALRVALRYPHLVTHLVLVAATGGIDVMKCGAVDWRSDYAGSYPQAQFWACDRVPDLSADPLAPATHCARALPREALLPNNVCDFDVIRDAHLASFLRPPDGSFLAGFLTDVFAACVADRFTALPTLIGAGRACCG
jgi:pimeloyl-ACP methyl ester carboxylesterase